MTESRLKLPKDNAFKRVYLDNLRNPQLTVICHNFSATALAMAVCCLSAEQQSNREDDVNGRYTPGCDKHLYTA